MADLRDSGSIEQDADIVLFLYRDDYYNKDSETPDQVKIIVSKNRQGATDPEGFNLTFKKQFSQFKDFESFGEYKVPTHNSGQLEDL